MKKTPIQVYLDARNRALMEELKAKHGLSIAETVRAAIRRWAGEEREEEEEAVLALIGTMDGTELPPDLSTRHDEYAVCGRSGPLAGVAERARRKGS